MKSSVISIPTLADLDCTRFFPGGTGRMHPYFSYKEVKLSAHEKQINTITNNIVSNEGAKIVCITLKFMVWG